MNTTDEEDNAGIDSFEDLFPNNKYLCIFLRLLSIPFMFISY